MPLPHIWKTEHWSSLTFLSIDIWMLYTFNLVLCSHYSTLNKKNCKLIQSHSKNTFNKVFLMPKIFFFFSFLLLGYVITTGGSPYCTIYSVPTTRGRLVTDSSQSCITMDQTATSVIIDYPWTQMQIIK